MKTKYLTGLLFLVVACSGGQTSGGNPGGANTAQLKKAAAEQHSQGSAQGDVCGERGWYGDGECDTFCQDADATDCAVSGGIVCAAFIEVENGFCSRKSDDPCISQDPDCEIHSIDPPTPGNPPVTDDPIICAAIAQLPDGVCTPDPNDPCVFYQDPDCATNGAGGSSGGGEPGNPGNPGGSGNDPGTPACKAVPQPSDGVCSRLPNDPCLAADPDCVDPVVCAEYIEVSDGVCKREPNDPCIFQDPDCHVK